VDVLAFFRWGEENAKDGEFEFLGSVCDASRADPSSQLRFLLKAVRAGGRKYDLVIANHVALAPVAAILKAIYGTPYWVSCHSIEVWWGVSRVRAAALKRADLLLPVSRYTAEVVEKQIGVPRSRMRVLESAVPEELVQLLQDANSEAEIPGELNHGGRLLLSVCALVRGNEFKGVDRVIEALPRIAKEVPDVRYVVAGDGEIRGALEKLARETGVAKNVVFLGGVSDARLAALYRRCDVFVLPSRGQEQNGQVGGEGFGLVYVEAAIAGKPVIASRSGGAAEAVVDGRTGFLVDPTSSEEIADAAIAILCDAEVSSRMGLEGQKWAYEKFSEKALARRLAELMRANGFEGESEGAKRHEELAHVSSESWR
jgi:phosphatidyl-myo-inositol dimannoside synthase